MQAGHRGQQADRDPEHGRRNHVCEQGARERARQRAEPGPARHPPADRARIGVGEDADETGDDEGGQRRRDRALNRVARDIDERRNQNHAADANAADQQTGRCSKR